MTSHDWFIEHQPDFVARALSPTDESLFREHLARCDDCRAAVSELEADLRWLPMGLAPVAPRPGFTHRVVSDVTRSRRPAAARLAWPLATAATVLLALGLVWQGRARVADLESRLARESAALAAVRDSLSTALGSDLVLQAAIEYQGRRGGMMILGDERTHRWKVVVHGIPAAPRGQRYTFWFLTADGMVRGAEVECDENNPAVLVLDMPPGARLIRGGSLTVEPADGDRNVPRGMELAHLEL